MEWKDLLFSFVFALGSFMLYLAHKYEKRRVIEQDGKIDPYKKVKLAKNWLYIIVLAFAALVYLIMALV
ncbi:hypothetical protein [Flavobacterium subsaxonicum]|uniref:hypothetical protein n=1 Tax=Flavobacterium subsaxonicum TaxID=426226 RepID=UPI000406B63F|nr:hypothetical protein [Flavobacterium subsaxonicum]